MENNTHNDQRSTSDSTTMTSFDTPNLYHLFLQNALELVNENDDDTATTSCSNHIIGSTMMIMSKKSKNKNKTNKKKKSNIKLVLLDSIKNIVHIRNMGIQSLSHHHLGVGNDDGDIHGTNMKLFLSIMTTIKDIMSDSKGCTIKDHDSDDDDDEDKSSLYDTLVSDLQTLVTSINDNNNKGNGMISSENLRWIVNSLVQELRTLLSHRSKASHALSVRDNEDNNNDITVAKSSNVYHDALHQLFVASISLWQWKLRTTILIPIVKGWMIQESMSTNDTPRGNVSRKRKTISDDGDDACNSNVGTPPPTSNSGNKRQHCAVSVTPPISTTKEISIETPPLGKPKLSSSPRNRSSQHQKTTSVTTTTIARTNSSTATCQSNANGTKEKNDPSIQKHHFDAIAKAWDDSSDDDDGTW